MAKYSKASTSEDKNNKNTPPDDFYIDWEQYLMNFRFAQETWGFLIKQDIDGIEIDIEESFMKPIGSIAWINSKVFPYSSIPIPMNQRHEDFKAQFKKAGGHIFSEIKFLKNQAEKTPITYQSNYKQDSFYEWTPKE